MQAVPETLYRETRLLDEGIIPTPRAAYFTPTYNCNQNCYYCFYKEWNNKGSIEPSGRIPEILNQLRGLGVQSVEFEGGGDALMTPNIAKIFQHAADMGLRLGLLTNGVLFEEEIAEIFLKLGTYVRFSLDSVNPETYKKIRGTNDCERVLQNIKNALSLREKLKSECQISIKIGIAKEIGLKEINDVYAYFKGTKLDNIQVKGLWNKEGKHLRTDINKTELRKLEHNGIPVIKKVIYPKLMNEPCWLTPVQIAADVFGDFYLCVYYMYRKESFKVGNMFEVPLKDLWGSDTHKEKIASIKKSECLIHDCRFQKYMRALRKLQRVGTWEFL